MKDCPDCRPGAECPYYCPVDYIHHPVRNMVTFCVEKAEADARLKSA